MKKILKIAAIVVVLVFIVLQFFRPDRSNPAIIESETLEASTNLPADVKAVLQRSCSDCHSNRTEYPWYSNISPFSWFLMDHISTGREEMNFSIWNTYSPKKKNKKLEEICEKVEAGEMPLPSYLWIHRYAALSESDVRLLCDWAKQEKAALEQ